MQTTICKFLLNLSLYQMKLCDIIHLYSRLQPDDIVFLGIILQIWVFMLDADISRLALVHEVSPDTLPIKVGQEVASFFVLRVMLKTADNNEKNIGLIAGLIKQNLLFLPEYEGRGQLAVWRGKLLKSAWVPLDRLSLAMIGLDLDTLWQGIILQVGGIALDPRRSLDEQIRLDAQREELEKKIKQLEKRIYFIFQWAIMMIYQVVIFLLKLRRYNT